jgi:hypothetical protein
MVSGLRHGVDYPDEELWTIVAPWCGKLGVLLDWWRVRITTICCVAGCQACGWNSNDLSWLVVMGPTQVL